MSILDHLPPRTDTWRDALSNSQLFISLNLLRWSWRFDCGVDCGNYSCELLYLYVDIGPIRLNIALGH